VINKAALDCMPAIRRTVIEVVGPIGTLIDTASIATRIGYPTQTTRRALEDLAAHKVVRRLTQGKGMSDHWELSDLTKDKCARAGLTFPEMSVPT
jgi:hypothetical protein